MTGGYFFNLITDTKKEMIIFIKYFIFILMIFICIIFNKTKKRKVYLRDFSIFKGTEKMKINEKKYLKILKVMNVSEESMKFQMRMLKNSEIGNETYFPYNVMKDFPNNIHIPNYEETLFESKNVMFNVVRDLLKKTKIDCKRIDFLIVNCSLFCPTPSLSSMIINKFKMKSTIKSINIGGMGCSAGIISIDLAKDLLELHPNSYALVVSTEIIGKNFYIGENRSMLIPNTLFRLGGAAILLTNIVSKKNKLSLLNTVRIHLGSDNTAFNSIAHKDDGKGLMGIELSVDLVNVAGEALKKNLEILGKVFLPLKEKIYFLLNEKLRKFLKHVNIDFDIKAYVPDFTKAFNHFCIHAGGKKVIDVIGKKLNLNKEKLKASRCALYQFGNTSSSSIWYQINYHFENSKMKKNEKIWQVAFGSGFKCNSAVWKVLKS